MTTSEMYDMTAKITANDETTTHGTTCYSTAEIAAKREHFRSLAPRGSLVEITTTPAKR